MERSEGDFRSNHGVLSPPFLAGLAAPASREVLQCAGQHGAVRATGQNLAQQVLKFERELEEGRVTECELQALCAVPRVPRDAEPHGVTAQRYRLCALRKPPGQGHTSLLPSFDPLGRRLKKDGQVHRRVQGSARPGFARSDRRFPRLLCSLRMPGSSRKVSRLAGRALAAPCTLVSQC